MAGAFGALNKALRDAAKTVVSELGSSLDTTIDYIRKFDGEYDVAKGKYETFDRPYYNLPCPVEFVRSDEEEGREERQARRRLEEANALRAREQMERRAAEVEAARIQTEKEAAIEAAGGRVGPISR